MVGGRKFESSPPTISVRNPNPPLLNCCTSLRVADVHWCTSRGHAKGRGKTNTLGSSLYCIFVCNRRHQQRTLDNADRNMFNKRLPGTSVSCSRRSLLLVCCGFRTGSIVGRVGGAGARDFTTLLRGRDDSR